MSGVKTCPQCGAEYEMDQRFCPKDGATLRVEGDGHDLVGSVIADRYHVLGKLGEGGMGRVYLAEHVRMGRKSAVKVMAPGTVHDADAISRFNREAANASRISHPNVAAVYDFGETGDGLIYLAMEYVEGQPLTTLIAQQGALPPLRAAGIARQAADALAAAHDLGIVHRDLKPDNILIARNRDGSDLVKIVDFGIAKAADNAAQQVTKTGLVVGTPEYMSPEQLAGDPLDGRSDIYSLALVTYSMLTGAPPFRSESAQEALILRLTDTPRPLAEVRPGVAWTRDVQAVMDRALARDANLRYQSAADFGRELYRAVAAMPQSAAADADTQLMEAAKPAIPATRVAEAGDRSPARPSPAVTPSGKSKVPLVAAVVTVAILGGGTALMLEMRKPPVPASPPPSAARRRADSADTGGPRAARAPAVASESAHAPHAGGGAAAPAPPVDVDAELSRIRLLADDGRSADQVLAELAQLQRAAALRMSLDQAARLELYRAFAYDTKYDTANACRAAKRGYAVVSDTALKSQLFAIVNSTSCSRP